MRVLLLTACLIAGAGAWAAPARAQLLSDPADGPVCRRPEVLDVVGRELKRRIVYAHINRASISEEPTAESDVVRCGLCLDAPRYDSDRAGGGPAPFCEPHAFQVQNLRAGFVVLGVD